MVWLLWIVFFSELHVVQLLGCDVGPGAEVAKGDLRCLLACAAGACVQVVREHVFGRDLEMQYGHNIR
ncbi:predicted protein [Chaetomium globosum CBS 148.51]|uniref:Secreted protein n=1 Tax=Chaetomium globosum (strain ATCC 6205 / CBS 148.51 / DSM 1962 / NBRC 6347 / NRRL 1970) TaxID=306901 RepID=Q2GY33_CHAGB|nr:uncharacterized protein CHGG_07121 [Chaetomium globosum CBS 148.51]EAQ85868.1 predicted protein [Chaetomium globosum CBS 148.51]